MRNNIDFDSFIDELIADGVFSATPVQKHHEQESISSDNKENNEPVPFMHDCIDIDNNKY